MLSHLLNLKDQSWEIDLVEKSPFLGAGNKTRYYGGHPYTFGPRPSLHKMNPYISISMNYCQSDYVLNMSL